MRALDWLVTPMPRDWTEPQVRKASLPVRCAVIAGLAAGAWALVGALHWLV